MTVTREELEKVKSKVDKIDFEHKLITKELMSKVDLTNQSLEKISNYIEHLKSNSLNEKDCKYMIAEHKENCQKEWALIIQNQLNIEIGKMTRNVTLKTIGSVVVVGVLMYLGLK